MPNEQQRHSALRRFSERNPRLRSIVYQFFVICGLVGGAYYIFHNTLENLKRRGVSTGFSFLRNEAGFVFGEVVPIPRLEGGFLYFLSACFCGLCGVYLLHKCVSREGKTIREDYRLILLWIFLVFGGPAITYYLTRDSIVTETYTATSSYGLALITGVFNTFKVSILACVLATMIGFMVGISRLSSNWLVSRLATVYVEIICNVPLLLQILFWYFSVIGSLPLVRQSIKVFDFLILNNRGVYLPNLTTKVGFHPFLIGIFIALVGAYFWTRYVYIRQDRTGEQTPVLLPALALLFVLPSIAWLVFGRPFDLSYPELKGFNYQGGLSLSPEFAALTAALAMHHGAFIAEIVRSGIQAVSRGQKEAAGASGLRSGQVMRLVVIPQAMRVIVPSLTNQYLSIIKNSSLGVAIAFPEIVSIGGTMLNQTGQAIEVIGISMMIYLVFSLTISLFMNWYNKRVRLVE